MSKNKSHSQGPYPHQTGNPDDMIRHRDGAADSHTAGKDQASKIPGSNTSPLPEAHPGQPKARE